MSIKRLTKNEIIAWMLFSMYAMFWLSWSAHHFCSHEHQHEKKVCRHAPNEKHIHSDEYGVADCLICHIAPTQAELSGFLIPVFAFPEFAGTKVIFGETAHFSVLPHSDSQPRAPPALLS
ncbi:MAG TPA: hypothetical protein PKC40_08145 [Saprospiraceae bacterium]|nr:hypothetical protein [Saprospiraceae bacterium]